MHQRESLRRQKQKVAVGSYPPRKGPGAPARTAELSASSGSDIGRTESRGESAQLLDAMPLERFAAGPPAQQQRLRQRQPRKPKGMGCLPLSLVVMMSVCSYIDRARSAAVMSAGVSRLRLARQQSAIESRKHRGRRTAKDFISRDTHPVVDGIVLRELRLWENIREACG